MHKRSLKGRRSALQNAECCCSPNFQKQIYRIPFVQFCVLNIRDNREIRGCGVLTCVISFPSPRSWLPSLQLPSSCTAWDFISPSSSLYRIFSIRMFPIKDCPIYLDLVLQGGPVCGLSEQFGESNPIWNFMKSQSDMVSASGFQCWAFALRYCWWHVPGSLARIGPNILLTTDLELLRRMSAARSPYVRSKWYLAFRLAPAKDNVFSMLDDKAHTKRRAQMNNGVSGWEVLETSFR